jgi:hypothetical protein
LLNATFRNFARVRNHHQWSEYESHSLPQDTF